MILNQDLLFNKVPAEHREAFRSKSEPQKILLPKGCRLYKFTAYSLENPADKSITSWWFLVEPRNAADPGYEGTQRQGAVLKCTVEMVARARAAVPNSGNSLAGLLQAELIQPVYGFYGQCSYQPFDHYADAKRGQHKSQARVVYIGGAWQVYIPRLTTRHIKKCD